MERELAILSHSPGGHLIVWPEVPAPFYPNDAEFRNYVEGIARSEQSYFLFGGVAYNSAQAPLNSAFLYDPSGQMIDRYDKINLVPFGEFVPNVFWWVNRVVTKEAGDFAAGSRIVEFPVNGRKLGVFICYESAFSWTWCASSRASRRTQVLMNLSNDGYFGHTSAREQHLELVRMRAAENRRWILRSTNDGVTATIDPAGRVVFRAPGYQELASDVSYRYVSDVTPYTRYGDWFAWGCLILAAILSAANGRL